MAQQSSREPAEQFITAGRKYFEWWHLEMIHDQIAARAIVSRADEGMDVGDILEPMMDCQRHKNGLRNDLKAIGMVLAEDMEQAGEDSSGVLTFLYAIDGGGGAKVAGPLWPGLKVQLQRMIIRGTLKEPKTANSDTWRPTKGFIKALAIIASDGDFVPRTTVQDWLDRHPPESKEIDPKNNAVYVPPDWVAQRVLNYTRRH